MFSFLKHKQCSKHHVATRREFVDMFSSRSGCDPDQVTEFILEIESVEGMSIEQTDYILQAVYYLDGIQRLPVIQLMCSSGGLTANMFIQPELITKTLEANCHFPVEAKAFFDFYMQYVSIPYDSRRDRLYADVNKAIDNPSSFSGALEHLLLDLS